MRKDGYIKAGKDFFATCLLAIGVIHLITGNFPTGLLPIPATAPARTALVYISGIAFCGTAILIMLRRYIGAWLAVLLCFCFLAFFHVPNLVMHVYDPNAWTGTFEFISLLSGALLLAGIFLPNSKHKRRSWDNSYGLIMTGRYLFATALIVFGVQHYIYQDFLINLIPEWVPARNAMQVVVMVGFFATALSLFIQQLEQLAAGLLAFMFFIWFCILHVPRVAASPRAETEWTSLFIVMAMCGISLLVYRTTRYSTE